MQEKNFPIHQGSETLKPEKNKPKLDFLISREELNRKKALAQSGGSSGGKHEAKKYLKDLDEAISKVLQNISKESIFEKLMQKNKNSDNDSKNYFTVSDLERILENYSLKEKLINLPEDIFGKILVNLPKDIQETVYIQRDVFDIQHAIKINKLRGEEPIVAYHVSSKEIKGGKIRPGDKEDAIYFSTDIKKLFDLKGAKYIYAFLIDKKTAAISRYPGAPDYFGKLNTQMGGQEIIDNIKIVDENDNAFRSEILDKLGAEFDAGYSAAEQSAENTLNALPSSSNELKY